MIWIFNIYSWVVSAVLCSDGVLSVPATKAFSESQAFYNFPCKFLLVLFHAASTKATKAEALQLCFVWHLIPYPRQCVVTQLGDNQIHVLPLFPGLKCAFAVRQPWRFSQDCRELDTWDVFGLLSHLASTLISSYSIGSGEGGYPTPSSITPLSEVPLAVLSGLPEATLHGLFGVRVPAVCPRVCRQTCRSALAPALCAAQPAIEPVGSLRKGFDVRFEWKYFNWEFYWSHAVKLYRGLDLIALSTLGQYTWENYS